MIFSGPAQNIPTMLGLGHTKRFDRSLRAATAILSLASLVSLAVFDRAAAQIPSLASPSQPSPAMPTTADAYSAVFDQWVIRHRPNTAILVVRRGGKTLAIKGHGVDPSEPTMIASLSKPITGACIATLIRDGKLSFMTRMRDALAQFFKKFGPPLDRRLELVTVEQLLVHRSGFAGNSDGDPIFAVMDKRAGSGMGQLGAADSILAEYLLKTRHIRIQGNKYSYSNTGYGILTAVIEERTGRSYEDYCREAVFEKLGIAQPKLHPDWRVLSGAGGWFIPGADYLAFLDIFDPAHPFLGDAVKKWIDQAQGRWTLGNRGRWYSLGINTWAGAGRWSVSHGGVVNSQGRDIEGRPTEASIVSHAFRAADSTAVFIALPWTPTSSQAVNDLRREIGLTHKLVKGLP